MSEKHNAKPERNAAIWDDAIFAGRSTDELVARHGISKARVHQILEKEARRRFHKDPARHWLSQRNFLRLVRLSWSRHKLHAAEQQELADLRETVRQAEEAWPSE